MIKMEIFNNKQALMHLVDLLIGWPMTRIAITQADMEWRSVPLPSWFQIFYSSMPENIFHSCMLENNYVTTKVWWFSTQLPRISTFYHPRCCERQDPNFITNITMTRWNQSNLGFHARIFQFNEVGVQYCEWSLECIINEPQSTHWWLCQTCWWSSNNSISFWIISCRDRVHQMLWTLHDIIYTHSINSCKAFMPKWGMHFCLDYGWMKCW